MLMNETISRKKYVFQNESIGKVRNESLRKVGTKYSRTNKFSSLGAKCIVTRDVPIPKFEPIPVPIPILNFKAKPIPILNRYRYRYLDFSVLKFIYTPFYSKGDTSRTGHS